MRKKEILVMCCHPGILETLKRLIEKSGEFSATLASSAEEALNRFSTKGFDLVLMGAGLAPEAEHELEQQLKKIRPEIPVVYHFGGGSGLLFTEIKQSLDQE
ncbi:response regulator [Pedobacter gandavensis]|uniref:response regulator n=1 Tax=Pedobacter gandavensis TaxID=2679963 RepID=UPI00293173B9|nr:response regulator [Pedobacter gandavensis]